MVQDERVRLNAEINGLTTLVNWIDLGEGLMRHFAALIGTLAFLAISCPASNNLFAQNSFQPPRQPSNQNLGGQNPGTSRLGLQDNSLLGNRTTNSSTTSGFNGANSQPQQQAQSPEIFVLKLSNKNLEDLKNGHSLTSMIPIEIRHSVKEVRLTYDPSLNEERTAGLPNNTMNSNRNPAFGNNNASGLLPNNNRLDSNRNPQSNASNIRQGDTGAASFSNQNRMQGNQNFRGGQQLPSRAQSQYDTAAGPPIPNRLNQFNNNRFNNDQFNPNNTQPINATPPPRFTPSNNGGNINDRNRSTVPPFQPRTNSGTQDSGQLRPSTTSGNEFDTTNRQNFPNNRQQSFAQNDSNRLPAQYRRSDQTNLQPPRLQPVTPRNDGYPQSNNGGQFANGMTGQPIYDRNGNPVYDRNGNPVYDRNGNLVYDQNGNYNNRDPRDRVAMNPNNQPLDRDQQQYQGLQNQPNDFRNTNGQPGYQNRQFANQNGNQYPNGQQRNFAPQDSQQYNRPHGSLIAGQDVPRDRSQLQPASNAAYRPTQNQIVQNQNNMQARIAAQQNDQETVGMNRGPNHETNNKPIAQATKINQILWFFLLCSIGLNLYLGWISRGFYVRYRELADELRETFSTV